MAALREIGFSEDRSAAETFDSQGTYKQQHDTGQNLKYLIVYPHVICASSLKAGGTSEGAQVIVDTQSPQYIVNACELVTFKEIVNSKTQAWRQRKRLLKSVQDSSENFKSIEAKLITGAPLSAQEQAAYDTNSGADDDKIAWVQMVIKEMVDGGFLTASEKDELLTSLASNIAQIQSEITEAREESKPKKVEKLEEKKKGVAERKSKVEAIAPIHHRLKHSEDILRLRLRLLPLIALEDKGRSMSLTMADLKNLEQKGEIEEAIFQLETASRCWFEDEQEFQERCELEAKEARTKYAKSQAGKKPSSGVKKASSGGSGSTGRHISSGSSWSVAGAGKKSVGSVGSVKKSGNAGFAAAFGGGDSDSD